MCTRPRLPASRLLLALGLSPCAALAQDARPGGVAPEDRAAIAACLRESRERPQACIGSIAVICARQPRGERRETEIACTRREAAVWRERLDAATVALAGRLGSGPRQRLAAEQRSWEGHAGLKCALMGEIQPPATAPVMQAGCELRGTAERAIEVETWLRRLARTSQPRPQIQR